MNIRLKGIRKSFGSVPVLRDIDLELGSGRFTTLLGPSGCGKTTLLRIVAGLERPDGGEVYFDDECVFADRRGVSVPPEKRGLGFVFQDFALWPHLTVFENVAFGLRSSGHTEELAEKVMTALHAVRLDGFDRRWPHELSGGQQQRVALARALAVSPRCILFDEPFSALDAGLREEMRMELRELVSTRGITSVFVTHDQEEAMSLSDDMVIMSGGRVLQKDSPEQVYRHPASPVVAGFVGQANWMGKTRMVRPEHLFLDPGRGRTSVPVRVMSSRFLGKDYAVTVSGDAGSWVLYAPSRHDPDERLNVFVDTDQIIQFKESV